MEKIKVTCLRCKQSDVLDVDNRNHFVGDSLKKLATNFLSYRWRPDLKWGYLCRCGNDNRVSPLEEEGQGTIFDGDPMSIKRIKESLKIPDKKQFQEVKI